MKTQEKNFDGIKLSGFTAILIMLALQGQPISTIAATNTEYHRRCHLRDMRCCHVTRIYDHPAKQFARIDFFRQICRNGH